MRITTKGQVTIPQQLRERTGLLPWTEVDVLEHPEGVLIVRARSPKGPTRGELLVERMRRAGRHMTMTTDEIMALTRGED
jgi:AbrB family looped-hinge helix DNA binding protein